MQKIDFKKEYSEFYKQSVRFPSLVYVPEFKFLAIEGKGSPGNQSFQDAIEALYQVSYTLKFMVKKDGMEIDYGVMPLQGLWWADDIESFVRREKDQWLWQIMIQQPDFITEDHISDAREAVKTKKNPVALPLMEHIKFREGNAGQIMHIGPFENEGPTVEKLHQFITDQGFELDGKHREIYLSDTRRAAPEKWRTIIRQPYKKQ